MPSIDIVIPQKNPSSIRTKQVCSMFDVPLEETPNLIWKGELPIETKPWSIGLIVGPSGCGKSTIGKKIWPKAFENVLEWSHTSVIDDMPKNCNLQDITSVFSSIGFNTVPAWIRPFEVLSNGEKFRVEIARRFLEHKNVDEPIIIDEFTSVVDRQVAKIASHALQKICRKKQQKFVAISCHYDIIDWLQPDWVLEPATMTFAWRSVQPRPKLNAKIAKVPWSTWDIFKRYHYMTADLHKAAQCYAILVDDEPVSFIATLHQPHPTVDDIIRVSRAVTLPDWQGLGLFFILSETIGAAYKAIGKRFRIYPAHPAFIRSCDASAKWSKKMQQGLANRIAAKNSKTTSIKNNNQGTRPCAVFEYVGNDFILKNDALKLLGKISQ